MKITMHKTTNKQWHFFVLIVGMAIGLIHHIYIYPYIFHADSSTYQMLASAIIDEKSLLPVDFFYGNQLILLKISPFISMATELGFSGYVAYAIGGAIAICMWFYICTLVVSSYFSSKATGLLLSFCLFIPFGSYDVDFLLGQESHLSNVVLSLLICLPSIMFVRSGKVYNTFILCISVLVMASESPIRAIIVIAPLSLFLISYFKNKKSVISVIISFASLLAGKLINTYLLSTHFPLRIDYANSSVLLDPASVINNFVSIFQSILVQSTSSGMLSGYGIASMVTPFYFIGLLYIMLFTAALFNGAFKYIKTILRTDAQTDIISPHEVLVSLASVGFVFGLVIVSSLNPDSGRHIYWAICLIKICVFFSLYSAIFMASKKIPTSIAISIAIAISMSSWIPIYYLNGFKPFNYSNIYKDSEINNRIVSIIKQTGISHIYGEDFWRMQLLNSFDSSIKPSEIIEVNHESLIPREWLSRPSWYCNKGDVLYYTKDGDTDKLIVLKLQATDHEVLYSGPEGKIWKGPVLWNRPEWCN